MVERSRWPRRIVLVLLVAAVAIGLTAVFLARETSLFRGALSAPTSSRGARFHTSPEKWSGPRRFFEPLRPKYEKRLKLQCVQPVPQLVSKRYSGNGAYWLHVREDARVGVGPWISEITIYNERDYALRLNFNRAKGIKANWVNNKLIYAEVWWGHALGSYALIDVETESIIQAEMIHSGTILYQQTMQALSAREEP